MKVYTRPEVMGSNHCGRVRAFSCDLSKNVRVCGPRGFLHFFCFSG
jgi:hypothetical protein